MCSEYVFVYGTLKRGEPNHHWITEHKNGSAEFVGLAQMVKPYPLIIATKYNIPFLLHHQGHGHNVIGEVYRVDGAMLRSLDVLEDHPNFYVREVDEVLLLPDGNAGTVECWVYFIRSFKAELLQLPCLKEYSSSGPHGLPYADSNDEASLEHLHSVQIPARSENKVTD